MAAAEAWNLPALLQRPKKASVRPFTSPATFTTTITPAGPGPRGSAAPGGAFSPELEEIQLTEQRKPVCGFMEATAVLVLAKPTW